MKKVIFNSCQEAYDAGMREAAKISALAIIKERVLNETLLAYADAHKSKLTEERIMQLRNLDFRASKTISRNEAIEIMGKAIDNGYNLFEAKLLKHLPADSRIYLAREGSVCIYVGGNLDSRLQKKMKVDEFNYTHSDGRVGKYSIPGFTRLWWD